MGLNKSLIVILVMLLMSAGVQKTAAISETLLDDGFENGLGNWVLVGNYTTVSNANSGSNSLNISNNINGTVYKQFNSIGIMSPNRTLTLYWNPTINSSFSTYDILSLEEGAFNSSDEVIEMLWNGSNLTFRLNSYTDGSITSTEDSYPILVSNQTWSKINIISNTSLTQIIINDTPVVFDGQTSSTILTNVYNWIRLSHVTTLKVIADDDGSSGSNTNYFPAGYRYRKFLWMNDTVSDISTANLSIYMDKDALINGLITVDVNDVHALNLSDQNISIGIADPSRTWYNFTIPSNLLIRGLNNVTMYRGNSTAISIALMIDTTPTTNRSARSPNSGVTWNYTDLRSPGNIVGEYMIQLKYTLKPPSSYYIDDILYNQNQTINTEDLFGRTFDTIGSATIPTGNDEIYAIYSYLLTRNQSYLTHAEAGATSIQLDYNSGNKNLFYIKEMALLSQFNSSRIGLLNNLTQLLWQYDVNHTTNLSYQSLNSDGSVSNYLAVVGEPPDALSKADAFLYAYKSTDNATYLAYAQSTFDAVYYYMRHSTYNTIITSVNATNGTYEGNNNNASRVADQISNFIETSLLMYHISGNQTYLTRAVYQANQFTTYDWDNINNLYKYNVDYGTANGYENYAVSISNALYHLYQETGNITYLNNAENNYLTNMIKFRRNGLLVHYFGTDGRYGHEPAYLVYDVPTVASKLYKQTDNASYLDMSDNYTSILLDFYYPTTNLVPTAEGNLNSTTFALDNYGYFKKIQYSTNLLYRFVLPKQGVNISWAYGNDLYSSYRGLASASQDVSFTRSGVTLYNVSGNGTIEFYPDITSINVTDTQSGSVIGYTMLGGLLDINPDSPGNFSINITTFDLVSDCSVILIESSSNHANSATHTITNACWANNGVQLNVDGTNYGVLTADASGTIVFIWTGYSEHILTLTPISIISTACNPVNSDINASFMLIGVLLIVSSVAMLMYAIKGQNMLLSVASFGIIIMGSILIIVGYFMTISVSNGLGCFK